MPRGGGWGIPPREWSSSVKKHGTESQRLKNHPGGNPWAKLKSISFRCYLVEVAFEWELTKETINFAPGLPPGRIEERVPGKSGTSSMPSSTTKNSRHAATRLFFTALFGATTTRDQHRATAQKLSAGCKIRDRGVALWGHLPVGP